jgi:hypothetical protein
MNRDQQMRAFDLCASDEAERSHYRAELGRLAHERDLAQAQVDRATHHIAEALPRALHVGVSVVEAGQVTGLSRPTVYRMLAGARKQHDFREDVALFEGALQALNQTALPFDLASYFQTSTDEVFECLMRLYPLLSREFASFGPAGLTQLVELLPALGVPERIILAMLLLQGLPTDRVAWSTKYSETEVLGWAALGLLRILPRTREAFLPTAQPGEWDVGTIEKPPLRSSRQRWRYPIGDPRRHQMPRNDVL